MTPIGGPPFLTISEQRMHILFERVEVEIFDFVSVVESRAHRIRFRIVLMQDVEVERLGPPIRDIHTRLRHAAMHYRAFA